MSTISPRIDMVKVAKAVADLEINRHFERRANPYHDLPPVDHSRRRRVKNIHADHCCGFEDPNFLH